MASQSATPSVGFTGWPHLHPRSHHAACLALSCVLASTGSLTACAPAGRESRPAPQGEPDSGTGNLTHVSFTSRAHMMRVRPTGAESSSRSSAAAPAPRLRNHGGKIVQAPTVVQVLYGPGAYLPELTTAPPPNMASAYREMVSTSVFGWLSEYSTSAPLQRFGRGRFLYSTQVVPANMDGSTLVTDANVQAVLAAHVAASALPAPDDNTVYMVHFPRGTTIVGPDGALSCSAFCAYHGTFRIDGRNLYYAVLPDLGDRGCATGCGSASTFDNQTIVASRELLGIITDPEVGLATVIGPPLGWYDRDYLDPATGDAVGEIGDICDRQHGRFTGNDGLSYAIQKGFSNEASGCITTRAGDPQFSGDDIVWRDSHGTIAIWFMNHGISDSQAYPAQLGTDWQIQGIGDFDGDHNNDIVWRNRDGTVAFSFMSRGSLLRHGISDMPGNDWTISGTGDFDRNGKSDIVWRGSDGQVGIWYMNGATIAGQSYPGKPGLDWTIRGVGDFDGDGTPEILWHENNGTVALWFVENGSITEQAFPGQRGIDWAIHGIGDFNSDGKTDILWRNVSGAAGLWFMNGGSMAGEVDIEQPGPDWRVQGVGDFNNDGQSDILWRNLEGTPAIWFMRDGTSIGQAYPGQPGTLWTIQGIANLD